MKTKAGMYRQRVVYCLMDIQASTEELGRLTSFAVVAELRDWVPAPLGPWAGRTREEAGEFCQIIEFPVRGRKAA